MISIHKELLALAERIAKRLREHQLMGKCITLKVKYSDFKQVTRSKTIENSTDDNSVIYKKIKKLLEKTEAGNKPIRLLGISVSQLDNDKVTQLELFPGKNNPVKRQQINQAVDDIQDKFGGRAILPGRLVGD